MNLQDLKNSFGSDNVSTKTNTHLHFTVLTLMVKTEKRESPKLETMGFSPIVFPGLGLSHYEKSFNVPNGTLNDFVELSHY